jgi:hypothetical protein
MKCQKCKQGELMIQELFEGLIFNRVKKIIIFCPLCDFENIKKFKLNEDTYQNSKDKVSAVRKFDGSI